MTDKDFTQAPAKKPSHPASASAAAPSHTPLPWTLTHISGSNFAVQEFGIRGMFGDAPNTYPIFNKDRSAIDGATVFCRPADAALIVKAVNERQQLVEALENIKGFGEVDLSAEWEGGLRDIIRACVACARAALTATEA